MPPTASMSIRDATEMQTNRNSTKKVVFRRDTKLKS